MTTPFPRGRRARVLGSRGHRALRPDPGLVGLGVRGVQRLVQRQDEPRAPVLAQPRPRGHPLLRPAGRAARRRSGHPGGLLAARSSRSGSGPATTTSATPPTTPTPPRSPRGCATSRCRRASGSSSAPARWRSSPTRPCAPRATPDGHCSRSARAPTRPAPASPAGTPTSFESTWCPSPAQLQQLHASAAADLRANEGEGSTRMTHAVALGSVRTASVSVARAPAARKSPKGSFVAMSDLLAHALVP